MKGTLFFILLLLITFPSFSQTNFYVSQSGDNSNDGSSISQAWQTIQYAMDNAIPNSIVNITAGTYNEKVEVNISGTAGNPIIFTTNNNDEVILDGSGLAGLDAIIGIFDQSYITIKDLKIQNNEQLDAQGIIVEGDCQGITIQDNEISNINFSANAADPVNSGTNSQPLIVYGSNGTTAIGNLIISGNIIHDSRTGFSEGLAVNGNVDGFEVVDNTVYAITNIGIDLIGHENTAPTNDQARNGMIRNNTVYNCKSPYATAAGIYVDGAKDLVIEGNRVYNCQWGIEVGCENVGKSADNISVRSNFIYDNEDAGISIGGFDYPSGSGKVENCNIYHNTLYANDKTLGGVGDTTGELNITYTEGCEIENNIFFADNPANLMLFVENVGSINLSLNYNLFYAANPVDYDYNGNNYSDFVSYKNNAGQDANSLNTNPLLSNTSTFDLHLSNTSPCKNSGNPAFAAGPGELDFDGESRIQGGQVDIGADEIDLALPVEYIVPFRAIPLADYIELKWVTAIELNNDHYIIQRSKDAQAWENLLTIEGQGNSVLATSYRALDNAPLIGLSYYRIKQMGWDGAFDFSNIVSVKWESKGTITIFPNPAKEKATLEFYNPQFEKHLLEVFNVAGNLILKKQKISSSKIELDVSEWERGSYFIRLTNSIGGSKHERLIII